VGKLQVGVNDLQTVNPALAAELVDQSLATTLTASSARKVDWVCAAGHQWAARVQNRSYGSGCPFCFGKQVLPGFNDLATTHPDLAAELADRSLATTLTAFSNKKVDWVCAAGHQWTAKINHRSNGSGCPFCSGNQVLPGFNDFQTVNPALAAELVDQSLATTLTASSSRKVDWVCAAGHQWAARVKNRSQGNGCADCASYGIDPNLPGVFYFVTGRGIIKGGIANTHSHATRLQNHRRQGLTTVLHVAHYATAAEAKEVENLWLAYIKTQQEHKVSKKALKDGYTEALYYHQAFEGFMETFMEVLGVSV
jgi:hypothetical protein